MSDKKSLELEDDAKDHKDSKPSESIAKESRKEDAELGLRSKGPKMEKSYNLNYLVYSLERDPQPVQEAQKSKDATL